MRSFSIKEYNHIAKTLLFEIIERIARFQIHLDEIRERFYSTNSLGHNDRNAETHLLDPYRECLMKILECSQSLSNSIFLKEKTNVDDLSRFIHEIQSLIHLINKLHHNLGFLPRPPEPPELKRFGRILSKYSMELSDSVAEIFIYIDEQISEESYTSGDPLSEFKEKEIDKIINKINKLCKSQTQCFSTDNNRESGKDDFHVTIPRIDASNPCRWPTLVHELAHKLFRFIIVKTPDMLDAFNAISNEITENITNNTHIDNKRWLEECWCDLFGAIVMGPAFWFSQASAFLFWGKINDFGKIEPTHPPPLFRLLLITSILRHRFKDAFFEECEISLNKYRQIFDYFDNECSHSGDGFLINSDLRYIFTLLKSKFINNFISENEKGVLSFGPPALNEHISSFIKYTSSINEPVIKMMVSRLAGGVPVPSYRKSQNDTFQERPSHVQEILLAAWLYRTNDFKNNIIENYIKILKEDDLNISDLWNKFNDTIVKDFKEFNFSVLRSIQVGEWCHLLSGSQSSTDYLKILNNKKINKIGSVLADYEIFNLLKSNKLLIIPLMNLQEQLGSTSLDIRLGTSFQIFYPNQVGIIDLTDSDSIRNANMFSDLIDLDYMQAVTLAPGQFVLAHSMEYIELPANLSADVEGRSSFARLGIEVHMTASLIDPGFQGVLTFEIFNAGPNPIKLYPGLRIAQLRFFSGNAPQKPYNKNPIAKYRGLLQHHNSLQSSDYEVELYSLEKSKENIIADRRINGDTSLDK